MIGSLDLIQFHMACSDTYFCLPHKDPALCPEHEKEQQGSSGDVREGQQLQLLGCKDPHACICIHASVTYITHAC